MARKEEEGGSWEWCHDALPKERGGGSVLAAEQSGKHIPTPQRMAALQPPHDGRSTLGHTATVPEVAVLPAIVNCPRTQARCVGGNV